MWYIVAPAEAGQEAVTLPLARARVTESGVDGGDCAPHRGNADRAEQQHCDQ